MKEYLLAIISGERRGIGADLLRGALAGLSLVYNAGLKSYLYLYRIGIRRQTRLSCPVISIGNLTVGGTGKTPMTRHVCHVLALRGLRPTVLIRGYRGESEFRGGIVSTREKVLLDAKQAGDEAYLLAKLLPGVPVVAGKDRRKTGALAIERFDPDVIVLDDGMQFYQLHRNLDIVLVNAQNPFDNGWTFPRGLLREPKSHLRRAGTILLTNADRVDGEALARLDREISSLAPGVPVLSACHEPLGLVLLGRDELLPFSWLAGRKVASLCSLGNPLGFENQLSIAGATVVHRARFPDHHEPTMGELNNVIKAACETDAEAVIVTEKDAVKLPPISRPLPFLALKIGLAISDEARLEAVLIEAIAA